MHTTFHDPTSNGSNFRYGRDDSSPWAVVDQKSPGQIGLKGAGAIDPNPKRMEYFIFCTPLYGSLLYDYCCLAAWKKFEVSIPKKCNLV